MSLEFAVQLATIITLLLTAAALLFGLTRRARQPILDRIRSLAARRSGRVRRNGRSPVRDDERLAYASGSMPNARSFAANCSTRWRSRSARVSAAWRCWRSCSA
jgi:hypothetical protein